MLMAALHFAAGTIKLQWPEAQHTNSLQTERWQCRLFCSRALLQLPLLLLCAKLSGCFTQAALEAPTDGFLPEEDAGRASALPTAADDIVTSNILAALSDSSQSEAEPQLEQHSFPAEQQFSQAPFDRRQAATVGNEEAEAVPMEGSMASAAWTDFNQLAQQRADLDHSLNWSIVVSAALQCCTAADGPCDSPSHPLC